MNNDTTKPSLLYINRKAKFHCFNTTRICIELILEYF